MIKVTYVTYIAITRVFVFDKRAGRVLCAITTGDHQFVLILDKKGFYERIDKSVVIQAFVMFIHYECNVRVSDMRIIAESDALSRAKLLNKRASHKNSQKRLF